MYNNQYLIKPTNESSDRNNRYKKILDREEKAISLREAYDSFSLNVQNFLVSESINFVLQHCLENKSDADREYGKVLCEQFVLEQDSSRLLSKFRKGSLLLHEMAVVINETYDDVMCKVDKDNTLTFVVKNSDKEHFYDKLSNLSTDKACKEINKRCCKAAEDFVQNSINDKLDMEDAATKAKEKINSIKADTEDKKKELQQEYARMYKGIANKIVYERPKNVYEQMIYSATNNIVKDKELSSKFVNESGKLDVNSIRDKIDVMYRFLETVNTIKIQEVNESYIKTILENIV